MYLRLFLTGVLITASLHGKAQAPLHTKAEARLSKIKDIRVGDTLQLDISFRPETDWHIYSLEKSGAYLNTVIRLGDDCRHVMQLGEPAERGERVSEYDEVMGGTLNYFKGDVTFSQYVVVTGKFPRIKGTIEYQICNGDKCMPGSWNFSLEGKAK